MKSILQFSIFLLLLNQSATAQQVVSYQFLQHYTIADVQIILNNFGVPTGLMTPEFEIDYYKVTYNTPNAQGTGMTIATGGIAIPSGVTCPNPIISYHHGTEAKRYSVPSYQAGEYLLGIAASSIFGAILSMPDYLGMGDSPGFHPYIHAESEASASIDLVRSVRELKDSIGYNLNGQICLMGYSQGGHSTMAVFKEMETNLSSEFTVTAAAPMSGPYDVSGVQAATITNDSAYATPGYLPYVIMGLQEAYGNVYTNLSEIFKSPYDTLLPGYFDGTHGMGWINNQLPDTPNVMLDSAYFQAFMADSSHFGWDILRSNDLYKWAPSAPLQMFYCTEDEQVFYKNALVAQDTMWARGATQVSAVNLGALTHSGCALLAFLSAFALFDTHMDFSGGMTTSNTIMNASSAISNDGTITVNPTNGVGPYSYEWQSGVTGLTTATVTGLNANDYVVRVSDSRGCHVEENITVSVGTSVDNIETSNYFQLMPNPAKDMVYLKVTNSFSDRYDISIIDMLGRTVQETLNTNLAFVRYDVSQIPNGTYLVRLQHNEATYTQKLIIQR